MVKNKSIEILNNLETGKFCLIGLPVTEKIVSDVIVVYLGRDKEGRFNFYDGGGSVGAFKLRKDFILERNIKIKQIEDNTRTFI